MKFKEFPKAGPGREFYYIDAMPGAGKTEYFVQMAAHYLRSGNSNFPYIYVAPTVELLVEAQERLFREVGDGLRKQAVIIVSTKHKSFKETTHAFVEPPVNALNFRLGLYAPKEKGVPDARGEETYIKKARLGAGQKLNLVGKPFSAYKVLMVTHEAFVEVMKVDEPEEYLHYSMSTVFFDEARQCVSKETDLQGEQMSKQEREGFMSVLQLQHAGKVNDEYSFFNIVGMVNSKKEMAKAFGVPTYENISKRVRDFIDTVIKLCANGRNVMTVKLKGVFAKGKWTPVFDDTFAPFIAMRPTELFSGYGRVILMSAIFTDSQMWHILKNHNGGKHTFTDILSEEEVYRAPRHIKSVLRKVKQRGEKNLKLAQKRLRVIPLTAGDKPLSLTYLNNSCMLPAELDAELQVAASNVETKESKTDFLRSVVQGKTVFKDKALSAKLKEYAVPPLWVGMREAHRVLKQVGCEEALLFINQKKASRIWGPAQIAYIDVVRDALKYEDGNPEHLTMKEAVQKDWIADSWLTWLKTLCHGKKVRGKYDSFFTVAQSTSVRGLNKYKDHVGYVHLAALNYEPDFYEYCSVMIDTYDPDLDNVVDNVLQTLYRTNIREPDSDKIIYMVTSSLYAINRLSYKLFRDENKFKMLPGYVPRLTSISYSGRTGNAKTEEGKQKQAEGRSKGGKIGGKKRRKYSVELGKELNKARALLRQAMNVKNPKQETIEKWSKEVKKLQAKVSTEKEMKAVRKILGT